MKLYITLKEIYNFKVIKFIIKEIIKNKIPVLVIRALEGSKFPDLRHAISISTLKSQAARSWRHNARGRIHRFTENSSALDENTTPPLI